MDVLVLIDKLDDLVRNAKQVPLRSEVRVDNEKLDQLRDRGTRSRARASAPLVLIARVRDRRR
jgi:hypothetical protein